MKHVKRLANGIVFLTLFVSVVSVIGLMVILTSDFLEWKYRNPSLKFTGVLVLAYIIGYLWEKL